MGLAAARRAGFPVPAIAPGEKFKPRCEFGHSASAAPSLTEKDIGKQGFFEHSVVSLSLMVIYITPLSGTALI